MLDYCANDVSGNGYPTSNPSMASILNMSGSMDTSRQNSFVLSSPPLAALHNLTEMKFPSSQQLTDYQQNAFKHLAANSTPHGINDILSRPLPGNPLGIPRINPQMYLSPQVRFPKIAELPGRQPIYWPGVLPQPWRPSPGKYERGSDMFIKKVILLERSHVGNIFVVTAPSKLLSFWKERTDEKLTLFYDFSRWFKFSIELCVSGFFRLL